MEYLQASEALQVAAEQASRAIAQRASATKSASNFDLSDEYSEVAKEAERLYEKRLALANPPVPTKYGAILTGTFNAGNVYNTIIFPLTKAENAKVYIWKDGAQEMIDWCWEKPILILKHTHFIIENGKQVGGVVVMFSRDTMQVGKENNSEQKK